MLTGLWTDLRQAIREARRHPSYSLTAFTILAFGLGINTAVFSVLYFVVFKPLPYRNPDQLVAVQNYYPQFPRLKTSPLDYLDLRAHREIFSDIGVYYYLDLSRGATEHPEKVNAVAVTESLLHTLDVKPLLGRTFTPDEERYRGPHAVILSESYWQSRFGRDPGILHQALQLNGDLYPIVGVMPGSFQFPNDVTEMWTPIAFSPKSLTPDARTGRYLRTYARLAPGVGLEQASARIQQISREISRQDPKAYPMDRMGWHFILLPMARDDDGSLRSWLAILFAAATCLVMIICSNVAGLFLVRSTQRQFDLSLRMALGASRFRLARQVLTEVMLIALGAGLASLIIAEAGIWALVKFGPKYLPSGQPALEPAVFWFAFVLSTLTGLICGAYPAWRATDSLALDGSHQRTTGARKRGVQNVLIVAQVAIATMLLVSGGLLSRSLIRLLDTRPGFDPRNVLTLQISLPPAQYATPESKTAFYNSVLEQVQRVPGVETASACTLLPFGWGENFSTFEIVGKPKPAIDPFAAHSQISLGFFDTLKIPVLRGRSFLESDRPNSELVTMIDGALARTYFPGEDPIGRQMRFPWGTFRIIGVARDIRSSSLEQQPEPTLYFSAGQVPNTDMTLLIRSRLPERVLVASVERIVHGLNKDQPVYDVFPLEARIARSVRTRRFVVSLILTFAASGAICAAIGLYGLLSYSIALRRRELGIRAALGADARAIAALVYRGGFSIVAAGVALGSVSALATRRYIAAQLYGTQFDDRFTWMAVIAIVALMSALACALPARRAAKLDPMEALRAD